MRSRAPAPTFGAAPAGDPAPARDPGEASGRCGLGHGQAAALGKRTPGLTFGTAEKVAPAVGEGGERSTSPQSVLDLKFTAVERAAAATSFGKGADRFRPDAARDAAEVEAEARQELELAAAYAKVLPRKAALAFSKSKRFADEWDGVTLRRDRKDKGPAPATPAAVPAASPPRKVKGAVAMRAAPPTRPRKHAEDPQPAPLTVSYRATERHLAGPTFKAPATAEVDPRRRQRREFRAAKAAKEAGRLGPGAYAPERLAAGFRAQSTERCAAAAGFAKAERFTEPPKLGAPERAYSLAKIDAAPVSTRRRAPAAAFRPVPKPKPKPGAAAAEPAAAGMEAASYSPRYAAVERRVTGGVAWKRAARPRKAKPQGKAKATTPAALHINDSLIKKRPPTFSFGKGPGRRRPGPPKLVPPERRFYDIAQADRWVKPASAFGVVRFKLQLERELAKPAKFGKYGPHRPKPGSYDVAQALDYLHANVPGPVFQLMSARWEDGVTGSLALGGDAAMLELAAALDFVRPAPPAFSFAPLPSTCGRRGPELVRPRRELQVDYALVTKRTATGVAWAAGPERFPEAGTGGARAGWKAELGRYDPAYGLVEPGVRAHAFDAGPGHLTELREVGLEGNLEVLDVARADGLVFAAKPAALLDLREEGRGRRGGALVDERQQPGDPAVDRALRPRIPGLDLAAGPRHTERGELAADDEEARRRGPGMYEAGPGPLGAAAPAADFALGAGRADLARADERARQGEGDRVELEVLAALFAARPAAPAVVFPGAARWPALDAAEAAEGDTADCDPQYGVVRPRVPAPVDLARQLGRADLEELREAHDLEYHDGLVLAAAAENGAPAGPDFARMLGRADLEELPAADDRRDYDVRAADTLRFPAPKAQGARHFERYGAGHGLDLDLEASSGPVGLPDPTALAAPRGGAVAFAKQLGRAEAGAEAARTSEADDLDAGCYADGLGAGLLATARHDRAPVVDFARMPGRAAGAADGHSGPREGDVLDLLAPSLCFSAAAAAPAAPGRAGEPFTRAGGRAAAGQEDANAGHGDVSRLNERGWRRAEALTAPTAAAAGFGVAGRFAEARPRDARAGAWEAQAFRSGGGVNPGAHFADGKQLDAAARRERRAAAVQKMLSRLQGPPAFPSPR